MAAEIAPRYAPRTHEHLSLDDFETASIRSAAPSYISEAPSYHSTIVNTEAIPPYSPPAPTPSFTTSTSSRSNSSNSTSFTAGAGLPRVPSPRRRNDLPQLHEFRIPTWSTTHMNPTARHYHSVAHRRVNQSQYKANSVESALRSALNKVEDSEQNRVRPLEDPHLVGEEAASSARRSRLARENGDEILIQEDRRWDWFLAHMKDWDERNRSWAKFRKEVENGQRSRLARLIGH